jgi:hypothetical protein
MHLAHAVSGLLLLGAGPLTPAESGAAEASSGEDGGSVTASAARLDLETGLGLREDRFAAGGDHIKATGGAISHAVLGGAWFAEGRPLGLAGRLEVERFAERGEDGATDVALTLNGLDLAAAAAGRAAAAGGRLRLEGQLGYGLVQVPVAARGPGAASMPLVSSALRAHGPVLAAGASFALTDRIGLEATGRLMPIGLGAHHQGVAVEVRRAAVGVAATFGSLQVAGLRLAGLIGFELRSTSGDGAGIELAQVRHQVGLGVRAAFLSPPAATAPRIAPVLAPPRPAPAPAAIVRGTLRAAPAAPGEVGAPLAEVAVEVAGQATAGRSAGDGRFVLEGLKPGTVKLRFTKEGWEPAEEVVSVPAQGEVSLEVELREKGPPAPASVIGLVRAESGAPIAARVQVLEPRLEVRADGKGRFRVELPAGRYTIVIEAPGFVPQRKVVQAGAGEQSIYNIDLQRSP